MLNYFIEIQKRVILITVNWLLTAITTYHYKEIILFLVIKCNNSTKLVFFYFIFTDISEILTVYIDLVKFLSFQVLFLYSVYHIFSFLNSAFFELEFFYIKFTLKAGLFIWASSIVLTNFLIIPSTWEFFLSFKKINFYSISLHFEAKLSEYFYFYTYFYYLCLFYCQFFLIVMLFFNYLNNNLRLIKKFRKVYYYFFLIFSTVIITSTTDIFGQFFLSLALILTYEFLIIFNNIKLHFNLLKN